MHVDRAALRTVRDRLYAESFSAVARSTRVQVVLPPTVMFRPAVSKEPE